MPACSQGPRVEKHAEAMDQEPRTKSYIQYTIESPADAGTHAEPRTTSQATKGKDQEPKTKSHKDHGAKEQGTKSQGTMHSAYSGQF